MGNFTDRVTPTTQHGGSVMYIRNEVDKLTLHLWNKLKDAPAWKPAIVTVSYTPYACVDTIKIPFRTPMWIHEPFWRLNGISGWITAQRSVIYLNWLTFWKFSSMTDKFAVYLLLTSLMYLYAPAL